MYNKRHKFCGHEKSFGAATFGRIRYTPEHAMFGCSYVAAPHSCDRLNEYATNQTRYPSFHTSRGINLDQYALIGTQLVFFGIVALQDQQTLRT